MNRLLFFLALLTCGTAHGQMMQQAVAPMPHYPLNTWTYKGMCYFNSASTSLGINCTGGGSSCAVNTANCTITTTGTGGASIIDKGDTIICDINGNNYSGASGVTISSITGGETWVHPSGYANWIANAGSSDVNYALSAVGGETSLTVTNSGNSAGDQSFSCIFAHWGGTGGVTLDGTPATVVTSACTTTCTGPTLTLSGTHDFVFALFAPQNNATSVNAPYSVLAQFPFGDGIAPAVNVASWTTPVFVQSVSAQTTIVGATAFKGQ